MPYHALLASALADALARQASEFQGFGAGIVFARPRQEDQAFVQWSRAEDGGLCYVDVCPTADLPFPPDLLQQLGFLLSEDEDLAALGIWTYDSGPLRGARTDEQVREVLQDLLDAFDAPAVLDIAAIPGD